MKVYSHLMGLLFLAIPFCGFAQQESFVLSGQILDANTREPISIVSLQNGETFILANAKGEFHIKVKPGDHLVISHTAYKPAVHVVEAGMNSSVEILLEEKVVELSEVEVNAFVSEERFKNEVLLAVPKYDYENKLAARNLQMIKELSPLSYANDLTSYNAFFKNSKSIHEISFISSNPSVGILKAIRQLGNRKTLESPPIPQRPLKEPWNPYGVRKKGHWKDYLEHQ